MTSLRHPTYFRRSSRHHNMWGTESGPYMIILRQGPEGEKYEMTEMCFLAKKLIPYWLFPLPEQEPIWSSSIRAGPCARVWEWEQPCFARSVFSGCVLRPLFQALTRWDRWGLPHWQGLSGWWSMWTYADTETKHQRNGLGEILGASGTRWGEDDCCFWLTGPEEKMESAWTEKLFIGVVFLLEHNSS